MNRRDFLNAGVAGGLASGGLMLSRPAAAASREQDARRRFKLKYAPHIGMFRVHAGADPIDQLKFMADQGFTAFEDNGMKGRPVALQEKMRSEMERLGMTMGVFVAHAEFGRPTFASNDGGMRERLEKDMLSSVEVARRVGARWCTVVPGCPERKPAMEFQTANVIENLKRCCDIVEKAGLVMVLEPLNPYRDHPGLFLTRIPQAYMICRAVNRPSCKILFDIYHQQITEGNIIPNIEKAWSEIAYFQVGDNPGRKEPGTGELNYRNIFRRIHGLGFEGVVGMEHGNSKRGREGELAVIKAYVEADAF